MSEQSKGHIKEGDFVELEYTGKIAASNNVFDTTSESEAKKYGIHNKEIHYHPLVVVAGKGHLVPGLDKFILGKEPGKYHVEIDAENGFGKKNAKLLRLVSVKEFHKHQIQPMPGLEVDMDGERGIIRTVNGGRVIVDFNHPLASQDIEYDIDVKLVDDDKKKIEGLLHIFKLPHGNVNLDGKKATVKLGMKLPEEFSKLVSGEMQKLSGIEVELQE